MLKWRRESVLDIYNLVLALFLFITPWLFAYANEDARIDLWASSVLIAVISLATFVAFSTWEEWFILLLGDVVGRFPVGTRIYPHTSDALQHWDRRGGGVHSDAGDLVAIRRGE